MKLSRAYITERLVSTSVTDLAVEIATATATEYPSGTQFDMTATIAKFERMLAPFAPAEAK